MKTRLCALFLFLAAGFSAVAADDNGPTATAQKFYDAYMKVLLANGDTQKYVLGSSDLTPAFKKAYTKLLKDGMDSDPIICGQDYPDEGYAASPAKFTNGKARVAMKSRSPTMQVTFEVTLRKVKGRWLISDTNDLKAEAND